MSPATIGNAMGFQMYEAALDAHGAANLPPADVALEFCAQVEQEEPGTYPHFWSINRGARREAVRVYDALAKMGAR